MPLQQHCGWISRCSLTFSGQQYSNIKHQPGPSGARLIIYNMLIIKTKQTFSTTIRNLIAILPHMQRGKAIGH